MDEAPPIAALPAPSLSPWTGGRMHQEAKEKPLLSSIKGVFSEKKQQNCPTKMENTKPL